MILAVDVAYQEHKAVAAGVLFNDWADCDPVRELSVEIDEVAGYEPGRFYKRELPCLLALLQRVDPLPAYIIIDGYVYLGGDQKPGLGRHLYEALNHQSVVIGVAKRRFKGTPATAELRRGNSHRALYVTAAGIDQAEAKALVEKMCGPHRLPAMLKRVDRLCKERGRFA